MRKLTALMLASSLALGASMANAAETTATPTAPAAPVATKADGAPMMMHHQMGKQGPRHGGMFEGLKLTDQQREQMKTIAKEFRSEHKKPMMRDHFKDMHKLVASDKFDESAARAQIEANSKERNDMMLERMKMENKMYNVLTPEQKKEFNQNFEKRIEKMEQRHAAMVAGEQ
ncbi:LTXXQ motif protein family protein [Hafnia alvei]|uniref:ATP-independent periplasmic protein-refolding chaperone Spy n=1 Tax=Hafnia alvei TaxID=569 RepID=UPI0005835481|nr:ATP-independent periplasmic protein-refolding chaperone Spy [Hafnia alvei]KID01404.1 LTXXQ motif protein family protein [Hafnia alvei]